MSASRFTFLRFFGRNPALEQFTESHEHPSVALSCTFVHFGRLSPIHGLRRHLRILHIGAPLERS